MHILSQRYRFLRWVMALAILTLAAIGHAQFDDDGSSQLPAFNYPSDDDARGPRKAVYPIPNVAVPNNPQGAVGPGVDALLQNPQQTLPQQPPPSGGDGPTDNNNPPGPTPDQTQQPSGGNTGTPWMSTAETQKGVRENAGMNDTIASYHKSTGLNAGEDTAWCSSFVNWTMEQNGIKGTNSASAKSWANWGVDAGGPVKGAVVVFDRGGPYGHVGFVESVNPDGSINVLGGNQSNSVKVSRFSTGSVIGYRLPPGYTGGGTQTGNNDEGFEENDR